MPCKHAQPTPDNVICRLGLYGGRPSYGVCLHCDQNTAKGKWPDMTVRVQITTPLSPVPHDQWPKWAATLAGQKTDADSGVGDTAKRVLGAAGEAYKAVMNAIGMPCRCEDRQAEWNLKYPYNRENADK